MSASGSWAVLLLLLAVLFQCADGKERETSPRGPEGSPASGQGEGETRGECSALDGVSEESALHGSLTFELACT